MERGLQSVEGEGEEGQRERVEGEGGRIDRRREV